MLALLFEKSCCGGGGGRFPLTDGCPKIEVGYAEWKKERVTKGQWFLGSSQVGKAGLLSVGHLSPKSRKESWFCDLLL